MSKSGIVIAVAATLFIFVAAYSVFQAREAGQTLSPDQSSSQEIQQAAISNTQNYKNWTADEYELAKKEGKTIMLFFTANWCPICREQEPVNQQVMASLGTDTSVVAFRVHILDSEETPETSALADKYGVPYQHTFVVLDSKGNVSYTTTGQLTANALKSKIITAKQYGK